MQLKNPRSPSYHPHFIARGFRWRNSERGRGNNPEVVPKSQRESCTEIGPDSPAHERLVPARLAHVGLGVIIFGEGNSNDSGGPALCVSQTTSKNGGGDPRSSAGVLEVLYI